MALFFTFCICYGLGKAIYSMSVDLYALIAWIFIALTGMADDFFSIKYREKFFLQVFAAIVMLQSGIYIDSFHGVFGIYEIPIWASYIVSIFVFIVIVNAFNLIDGIDGLSALLSIKFFLLVAGIITISSKEMFLVIPSIVGGITGFFFNFNPVKKVFLGDTGALLLGSVIAFFHFLYSKFKYYIITDDFISRPLMVILLIIYPLADTLRASLIRMYKGKSPFLADRVHLHHRLIDKGYNHWGASSLILGLSITVVIVGVFSSSLSISLTACSLIILIYLAILYYIFFN